MYGPHSRMTATLSNLLESSSSTALTNCWDGLTDGETHLDAGDTYGGANLDRIDSARRKIRLLHNLLYGQFHATLDISRGGSFVPCQDLVILQDDSYQVVSLTTPRIPSVLD